MMMKDNLILEQATATVEDYEKIVEKIKKFNDYIKRLQDTDQAKLEHLKNEQNNPIVKEFKEKLLQDINNWYAITLYTKQSKNRELVEFTKTKFHILKDTLIEADGYIQQFFPSYVSEFDPVFQNIIDNYYVIVEIPVQDLVDGAPQQPPSGSTGSSGPVTIPPGPAGGPQGSAGPSSGQPPQGGSKEQTAEEVFNKYMVGPFDPNSSMDRGKMEVVKNMLRAYESKYGTPFNISNSEDITKMEPIANAAYQSAPYKQITSSRGSANAVEPALYKTRKGRILGMGGEDVYSPEPPPIGTKKYEVIDPKTGKVTQVRRATPVNTINIPKPGSVRVEDDGTVRRKSKFGGALGSLSNLFGDVGNTLKKNK